MIRLCLLLLLLFAPWPASGGSALPDDRPLRVVMDNTYPPYVFLDGRGTPQGILPDLWRLWQERTGIPVEITALDWHDAQAAMRAGRHDVIDTAFRTEERDRWLEFGRPYAQIEVAAFFDNEIGGITDIDSLRGFAVAVKEGDAVIGHLRSRGVDNLLLFKGYEAIVEAARDNKVNVFVTDQPPALHYLHKYNLHRRFNASLPLEAGDFHRAVARGQSALLAEIEAGFAAIPEADRAAIDRKWRGLPLLDRLPLRMLLSAAGGACALILALFLWNRTLRRAVRHRTTELEQSREVLRQSEARYRELVEDANSIILRLDSTGRITFFNEFAQRFFGYRAEEVLGENVVGTIVPERDSTGGDLRALMADLCARPERYLTGENENMQRDGSRVWISWTNRPVYDQAGHLIGLLCVGNDVTERRRASEALGRERERLASVISGSRLGAWEWNVQTGGLVINETWAGQLGRTLAELEPCSLDTWAELVHPDDLEPARRALQRCVNGDSLDYDVEFRLRHRDGRWVWILSRGRLLTRDPAGRPLLLFGTHTDITGLKQAEEDLRTSNELLSLFIHHSPIYAFIKEIEPDESRTLRASENYRDMVGIPGSAMVGRTMHELFPPEFADRIVADDRRVVERGEILQLEEELDGRSYTTIKFPITFGSRQLLAGYSIDVTERRRTEEALRRREEQLQQMIEILPIGLWITDRHGSLLRGNPAGRTIWGGAPAASDGLCAFPARRLPGREPVAPEECGLARTLRTGATVTDELLEIEAADGTRKTILAYSAPVRDDRGDIDGAILVHLDISDRKALEEQLIQAQKMESIGRLAGGVAHDFNNMLSVILGHTELALDTAGLSATLSGRLQSIREAVQRSTDLTQQLLAFARRQTAAPRVLDLNTTVAGMLKMIRRLIGEDIDLTWLPAGGLPPVRIDPSQVDQILVNLCVNARDAIGDTGRITIETASVTFDQADCLRHPEVAPGGYVRLSVRDTGCGMDDDTLAHLFEPFFTTKELGKGTGLGLATVYGIVRQNGGCIEVDSRPDRGAVFRIYLPRHDGSLAPGTTGGAAEPVAGGTETILLVEDEPLILEMATAMLTPLGYTVLPAATPATALRLAREHAGTIDLLLTDVVMPEMNGRDLAARLVEIRPGLRRLFMSGYTADVIASRGVLEEGVEFVQKPFTRKRLVARIRQVLDRQEASV